VSSTVTVVSGSVTRCRAGGGATVVPGQPRSLGPGTRPGEEAKELFATGVDFLEVFDDARSNTSPGSRGMRRPSSR
jgi:hypothetical protein